MTLFDVIYNNYLEEIQKAKEAKPLISGEEAKRAALSQTAFAVRTCFECNEQIGFRGFTSRGQCRTVIRTLSNDSMYDFKARVVREYVEKLLNDDLRAGNDEKNNALRDAVRTSGNSGATYDALMRFIDYGDCRVLFANEPQCESKARKLRMSVDNSDIPSMIVSLAVDEKEKEQQMLAEKVSSKHYGVSNFRINNPFARRCALMAATDKSWRITRNMQQTIGNDLYASSDIGKVRKNQEDSVLIMYHPKNPDFKMLVVSDGMGGAAEGEIASSFVAMEIQEWFKRLSPEWFDAKYSDALRKEYETAIAEINKRLYERNERAGVSGGATFCGAIVTEKDTIISNVGDSRAYMYDGRSIIQLTSDDSVVWKMETPRNSIEKESLRFRRGSNVITQSMGSERVSPVSTVIKNSDYKCLMLFSDGVTDCLSDATIKAITESTPFNKLAEEFVKRALDEKSFAPDGLDPKSYYGQISGGKDNTTAAVFVKRDGKSKRGGDGYEH